MFDTQMDVSPIYIACVLKTNVISWTYRCLILFDFIL